MVAGASLQLLHHFIGLQKFGHANQYKRSELKTWHYLPASSLSSRALGRDALMLHVSDWISRPIVYLPVRHPILKCYSSAIPNAGQGAPILRNATLVFTRSCNALVGSPLALQLFSAAGIIAFALWGLGPLMWFVRNLFHNDGNWKKSKTHYISTSYLQPLLLWTGVTLICRGLEPIYLPSEASQVVKQRVLNFVRSLSTVLAFAYCLSSLIQQTQKLFLETGGSDDARKMGFHFAGKAIYTAVWVAAISLFMELLGFSTQRWLTAGGLGTVLLTLAGREIFTNFLSSVMIHATRPFIVNEWIQTKIEGYEVSGTVEHVGWWSPTIIRGEDREAVHIPNHKFTVSVVRNLSQKTHWRIKTHLAISHLDANKITNIVADMRKVLAKNPQIEQQRLHRRVFLDNIDPENQALLILISCFVKTSHFEEYLCVKESVLLDLLRVISHHRARLATPIRTVQKEYGDPEIINIPFAETIYNSASPTVTSPFLLVEPPRINGDKTKSQQTSRVSEDQVSKTAASELKATPSSEVTMSNSDKQQDKKPSSGDGQPKSGKVYPAAVVTSGSPSTSQPESLEPAGKKGANQKPPPVSESSGESSDGITPVNSKSETERLPTTTQPVSRPSFEDNIVLGVALEGSKRTLPIEEGMRPSSTQVEPNEMAASRTSTAPSAPSKDNKGPVASADHRDQER